MLTLYYVTATFLQSWKIKNVCTKIAEKLAEKASVVFYMVSANDGYDAQSATSELCTNRSQAKVSDILWLYGEQRGSCLEPLQTIYVSPWVSFPHSPNLVPFEYNIPSTDQRFNKKQIVHLLIETESVPCRNDGTDLEVIRIENYGKLIAWKVDSHFAVLIETDLENFTKLIIATFMQNNFLINDQLPLIRIESVKYEGNPQPFELVTNHLRKQLISRSERHLTSENWKIHLDGLRGLSVLANQAIEFEYNKNRTEGKTGIVKPDLIPNEKKTAAKIAAVVEEKQSTFTQQPPAIKSENKSATSLKAKHDTTSATKLVAVSSAPQPNQMITEKTVKFINTEKTQLTPPKTPPSQAAIANGCESTLKVDKTIAEPTKEVEKVQQNLSEPTQSPQTKKLLQKSDEQKLDPPAVKALEKKYPSNVANEQPTSSAALNTRNSTVETVVSVSKDNAKRPSLRRNKDSLPETKPLNILVYSDSATAREGALATLREIVEKDVYTIYPLTAEQVEQKHWIESTMLFVVCGSAAHGIGEILVDYFLRGGKVLSLCSDILHIVLPTYRTAEVREHELVQFSYDKWQKVTMMHHIFCYQPSPVKKNFSTDSDDMTQSQSKKPALVCPRSVELKDLRGDSHNLDVKVLGSEETWNTPSLLLADNVKSGGRAVFSQVHLETNPSQFESDEIKYSTLKQNEKIRLDIFADLLCKHLNVNVRNSNAKVDTTKKCTYKNAYFLGRHESKFELLEKLKDNMSLDKNIITTSKLTMKFFGKDDIPPKANGNILSILTHSCPEDFSTVDYFDNLKTKNIGRLVIYAPLVGSSMDVISDLELTHGIAVLPRQQTDGTGRQNNQWISPLGCAMFSLQLHISINSPLGSRISLIQHIIATAVVNSIKSQSNCKNLDIRLKWPNDIYANGLTKIGGIVVATRFQGETAVINIGCGINLDNSKPTTCINDLIAEYNKINRQNKPLLRYEQAIAAMFNEIESLIDRVQSGDIDYLYQLYYQLWLHNDQNVSVFDKDGKKKDAKITGIDEYGYLKVKMSSGSLESVQPDGNTFDMFKGLIIPKFN